MALNAAKLFKIGGGGKQIFLYETADAIATVKASGYFNGVTNQLKQFDVIIAVTSTGGTAAIDVLAVTSATDAATVTTVGNT